jgi:hypothetical protein
VSEERPKAEEPAEPPAKEKTATVEAAATPTRDEAVNKLRHGDIAGQSKRVEEIVAEALSRGSGVANVNLFSGDFSIAGDFTAGTETRRGPARRAAKVRLDTDAVLEEYKRYARPVDFAPGVDTLDLRHLLVIADRAHIGREARAHATLVEVLLRNNLAPAFIELSAAVLGNMGWRPPQRECGYVVLDRPDGRGKCAAEAVDEKWLAHAAEQARAADSYLVVVTGPVRGQLAKADNRATFVVTDLDLPAPGEVMRRWLLIELGGLTEAELDEMLGTEIDEILDEHGDPHFAMRVAKAVGEALRTGSDLSTVVARLRDPEEQVREWLGSDPDGTEVALVLATATLEDCGFLSVSDAAVSLHRRFGGSTTTMAPRYLRKLLAERSWIDVVQPDHGPRVVRFRHAGLRAAVLALTWFELDGARQHILDWLDELAHHDDVEVRTRAASTAGLLAARDLQHGLHRFFLPWAQEKSPILHQSAATGLNVAGNLSGDYGTFWKYVEQWAEQVRYDEDERDLPATAALAAGGSLGVAAPERALRVLGTLVTDGGWDLLEPVAVSTNLLLVAGRVRPVVDALLEWTDSRLDEELAVKALTVFAFAAGEMGPMGKSADDRPVLFRWLPDLRDELPELWGRALDCEPVRDMAADGLRAWVEVADDDPALGSDVLDLLAGIADRGEEDYRRLCHLLEKWAEDHDAPSGAAGRFHTELVQEGELVS